MQRSVKPDNMKIQCWGNAALRHSQRVAMHNRGIKVEGEGVRSVSHSREGRILASANCLKEWGSHLASLFF